MTRSEPRHLLADYLGLSSREFVARHGRVLWSTARQLERLRSLAKLSPPHQELLDEIYQLMEAQYGYGHARNRFALSRAR